MENHRPRYLMACCAIPERRTSEWAKPNRAGSNSDGWVVDLALRELRVRGVPVAIGGRAFEIVELLARSAGKLVTKDDLMKTIWPGAVVEDNTIQVHISAIRRALGPDRGTLKTFSGRGYRLQGNWTVREKDMPRRPDTPRPAQRGRPSFFFQCAHCGVGSGGPRNHRAASVQPGVCISRGDADGTGRDWENRAVGGGDPPDIPDIRGRCLVRRACFVVGSRTSAHGGRRRARSAIGREERPRRLWSRRRSATKRCCWSSIIASIWSTLRRILSRCSCALAHAAQSFRRAARFSASMESASTAFRPSRCRPKTRRTGFHPAPQCGRTLCRKGKSSGLGLLTAY